PCCHLNHAYLDCALELLRAPGVSADAIESIECHVPAGEVPIVCEPVEVKRRPRTSYDAQFSLPFSVAAAFLDGAVGVDTYAPARLGDERVLRLASRVRHVVDPDSPFPRTFPGWVRVRLADGRELEARVPHGRGGPDRPLPPEALVEKFRDNARRALPAARLTALERAAPAPLRNVAAARRRRLSSRHARRARSGLHRAVRGLLSDDEGQRPLRPLGLDGAEPPDRSGGDALEGSQRLVCAGLFGDVGRAARPRRPRAARSLTRCCSGATCTRTRRSPTVCALRRASSPSTSGSGTTSSPSPTT